MLIEKDSKILDISSNNNKQNIPKEYNINSNFFNDWIVVDDIEIFVKLCSCQEQFLKEE